MSMKRLVTILRSDPTWLEVISTVFLSLWAALLLYPYSTFQTSQSYAAMAFINEYIWGVIALAFAAVGYAGLFKNHFETRRLALMCGQFFWGTVGACILLSNPGGTGGWVYLALALGCMIAYLYGLGRQKWTP